MFAKGGLKPILLILIPFLVISVSVLFLIPELYYIALILIVFPILTLYFFRDPDRKIEDGITSPADGKIVFVDKYEKRIAIFMSVFDVHVNRSPFSGKILKNKHYYGPHHPAYSEKCEKNEKNHIKLKTKNGIIDILQITGIFARRIVPYVKNGDNINKGDKIGLIRFGSRVEIMLPQNTYIYVEKGEKIKAGEKIGEWNE